MQRMSRTVRRVCALAILLFVGPAAGRGACADAHDADRLPFRIERDTQRFRFAGGDDIMKLLAIRPGMTILDIGTGTGQFAYDFARRLNGTGMVYATDTRAYCVDYVNKEAERRGLRNLQAVLVATEGVDEFYGKHRYDLIAIFHVALDYGKRADYLRQLRGCLADGGRLILVVQKVPTLFSIGDFAGNFGGLVRELSREPAGSPYLASLAAPTIRMIREYAGGDPPEALKRAVVEDLNGALQSEDRFFGRFLDGTAAVERLGFSPRERLFVDYLLVSFRNRNPARAKFTRPDPGTRAPAGAGGTKDLTAMLFNKLLIAQRFRAFLSPGGLFASGVTPEIRAAFGKAGYRLQREYPDVIPFEELVIFSAG